ncbi:MAG: GntR family transcriptional regulator [Chloroflexi bacterium]|nr:GntR family transcriptional regulator [Chloroflexota bacterium]
MSSGDHPPFAPQAAPSLRERVYDTLRDAIIAGRLKPGQRLKERDVAGQMRISTTPVKEALRRLEQEGLVDSRPRQGGVVSDVALTSVREIVETRAGLEGLAARFASAKMTELEFARMREHLAHMLALTEARAVDDLVLANAAFHTLIRNTAHNHFLSAFVATIGPFDLSVRQAALRYPDEAERGYQEHAEIAQALQQRAGGQAEELMRSHIMRTVRFVIDRAESAR